MFEKEAEEYLKTNNLEWELECHRTSPIGEVKQAYQKGAEFGYNKANEWHYVKDGKKDLPRNNTEVLVLLENKRLKISIFMENVFTIWNKDYDAYTKLYGVIAWKEIVVDDPPKIAGRYTHTLRQDMEKL